MMSSSILILDRYSYRPCTMTWMLPENVSIQRSVLIFLWFYIMSISLNKGQLRCHI